MKALIDGDIITYRCGFASEDVSEAIALSRADQTIERIIKETKAIEHQLYLSDNKENNFRYKIYPAYKANRTKPLPRHYQAIKDHLIKKHNAVIALGQEADDALGIEQCAQASICPNGNSSRLTASQDERAGASSTLTRGISAADCQSHKLKDGGSNPPPATALGEGLCSNTQVRPIINAGISGFQPSSPINSESKSAVDSLIWSEEAAGSSPASQTIICSIDKDLRMIPGKHYNFVTGEFFEIEELEGLYNFYEQLLIGDRVDNIIGVNGIGAVRAPMYLRNCVDEEEMFTTVRNLYGDDKRLLQNGQVLWIRRQENQVWKFPNE